MLDVTYYEALITASELIQEFLNLSGTKVYEDMMEKLDISDEYLQAIHKVLRKESDDSV